MPVENKMEKIFNMVADMTIKRIEKEKATKLSRRTLKMIALTLKIYDSRIFY
ncbi:MAG: hypothetical protein Q4G60_15195 [bacterium]|nr:hypothetical protein [bacterium]